MKYDLKKNNKITAKSEGKLYPGGSIQKQNNECLSVLVCAIDLCSLVTSQEHHHFILLSLMSSSDMKELVNKYLTGEV